MKHPETNVVNDTSEKTLYENNVVQLFDTAIESKINPTGTPVGTDKLISSKTTSDMETDFGRFTQGEILPVHISIPRNPELYEDKSLPIARAHYINEIIKDLQNISDSDGTSSVHHANKFFSTLRKYEFDYPHDVFTSITSAIHDGLAYKDIWIDKDKEFYASLIDILKKSINRKFNDEVADKTLSKLEELGLDITPIEIIFEMENE